MARNEAYSAYEPNFARDAGDWVDARVYGGLQSGFRGGLEVLASGFGKGLMLTAAVAATAIMAAAIVAPGLTFGAQFAGITAVQSVQYALPTIGNWLLGTGAGWGLLAAGGAAGSLVSAWSENSRIGREAAECQAARYKQAREAGVQPQQAVTPQPEIEEGISEGHCARLLREQAAAQQQGATR